MHIPPSPSTEFGIESVSNSPAFWGHCHGQLKDHEGGL